MGSKIEYRNSLPIPLVTQDLTQGVDPAEKAQVRDVPENLGFGRITDTFEQSKPASALNVGLPTEQMQPGDSYSVNELRMLISAAKAENKSPFTIPNLNRLLAGNINNYNDIAADLKGWINKNLYLTPRQKAPLDNMSEDDLKKLQDSARTATELGKRMVVEIQNQPGNTLNKVLEFKYQEIADDLKLAYEKVPQNIPDQKIKEAAQDGQM